MVKEVCNMEVLKSFEVDESSKETITLYEDDDNSPEWLIQVYQDDTNDKEKNKRSNNSLKFGQKRKVFANNHNDNKKKINALSFNKNEYWSQEKTNDRNFELIEITIDDSNEKSSLNMTENFKNPENNELTLSNPNTIQNIITNTQTPQNISFKNINQKTETSNQREAINIKENNGRLPRTKVTPHRVVKKSPGKIDAMKKNTTTNKKTEDPAKFQSKSVREDQNNINVNDQINNICVFPPHTPIQDPVNEKLIEMLTKNLLLIYPARYNYVKATTSMRSDPQWIQITAQELERRANRCFEASHSILTVLLEQNIPIISTVLDCYRKKLANDKDINKDILDLNFFEWFLNKMINMTKNRQLKFNQYADDLIRALKSDSSQQHPTITNISKRPLFNNSLESTTANNLPTNATGLTSSLLFSGGTTDREIRITYEPSLIEKQKIVQHIPTHRFTHYVPQSSNSPQVAPNVVIHQSVTTIPSQNITPSIEQLISRFQQQPPNFQQQMPNFQQQMPSVQPQMPSVQQQMTSIQQPIPNFHQQAQIFQHQIPSFQKTMKSLQQPMPSALVSSNTTLNKPPPAYHHQKYHQATPTQNLSVSGQIYPNIKPANANIDKPMNYNHNATAPATNIQQRSSVSRDSGIVSPRYDERPFEPKEYQNSDADETSIDECVPVISYVTSMNPDVLYSPEGKCHICNNTTNLRCLGCNRMYYCTVACQQADWNNHKFNCRTEKEGNKNDHTIQCLS